MKSAVTPYNPKLLAGGLWHPQRRMPLFFCVLTLALLIASATAHFSSYLNFNSSTSFPNLWLVFHLSIFFHFAIGFFYKRRPLFSGPSAYVRESQAMLWLMIILFTACLFYAMINFMYYELILRFGYPDIVDGRQLLIVKGGSIELSAEQFPRYQLYQARKVSGHWMVCHVMALMGYYDWLTDKVV